MRQLAGLCEAMQHENITRTMEASPIVRQAVAQFSRALDDAVDLVQHVVQIARTTSVIL
jgi:cell fate (sporulation/competence/biofilm development) regulator YmcA (YheA/YmcA/DUF963 family)